MPGISLEYLIASCALDCSQQSESNGKTEEVGVLTHTWTLGSTRLLAVPESELFKPRGH